MQDESQDVNADGQVNRSRRGSLSSSRFSSRVSRRSSVRDEIQTLDEFLRKQRVIRYMQEERERAARTKLLREEHDAWVEFHASERANRIKYMTEQEIAELLQREAEEALREKSMAEVATKRTNEDAVRRCEDLAEARKKEEDSIAERRKSEAEAESIRKAAEQAALQRQQAMTEAEDAHRVSLKLRQREEDLLAQNRSLTDQLAETKRAAEEAKAALTEEKAKAEKEKAALGGVAKQTSGLQKQIADLQRQLSEANGKVASSEVEKAKLQTKVAEKDSIANDLQVKLEAAQAARKRLEGALAEKDAMPPPESALQREVMAREAAERKAADMDRQLAAVRQQLEELRRRPVAQDRALADQQANEAKECAQEMKKAKDAERAEREKCEKALQELARAQEALKKEQAAHQADAKRCDELQQALEAAKAKEKEQQQPEKKGKATPNGVASANERDAADKKRAEDLEKVVASLREDRARDANAVQCLKNELQSTQEELEHETAARVKFEELAAQVVGKDGRVPRAELLNAKEEAKRARQQMLQAQKEAQANKEAADKELKALREWTARLQAQLQQQRSREAQLPQHARRGSISSAADQFTPRYASGDSNGTPRHVPSTRRTSSSTPAGNEKLQSRIRALEKELAAAQKSAKRAEAEEPLRARAREKAAEQELAKRLDDLQNAHTALQQKYECVISVHRSTDAARLAAEQQVKAQKERIMHLEEEAEAGPARAPVTEVTPVQPAERSCAAAGSSEGNGPRSDDDFEDRLRRLEEELQKEREARAAVERQLAEELQRSNAAVARAEGAEKRARAAEAIAKAAQVERNSSGAAEQKPVKTKTGCC